MLRKSEKAELKARESLFFLLSTYVPARVAQAGRVAGSGGAGLLLVSPEEVGTHQLFSQQSQPGGCSPPGSEHPWQEKGSARVSSVAAA